MAATGVISLAAVRTLPPFWKQRRSDFAVRAVHAVRFWSLWTLWTAISPPLDDDEPTPFGIKTLIPLH
jgi:hypothetical protein